MRWAESRRAAMAWGRIRQVEGESRLAIGLHVDSLRHAACRLSSFRPIGCPACGFATAITAGK